MGAFIEKLKKRVTFKELYTGGIAGLTGGDRKVSMLIDTSLTTKKPAGGRIFLFSSLRSDTLLDIYTGTILTFWNESMPMSFRLTQQYKTNEICSLITACIIKHGVGSEYIKYCNLTIKKETLFKVTLGPTIAIIEENDGQNQTPKIEITLESGAVISSSGKNGNPYIRDWSVNFPNLVSI